MATMQNHRSHTIPQNFVLMLATVFMLKGVSYCGTAARVVHSNRNFTLNVTRFHCIKSYCGMNKTSSLMANDICKCISGTIGTACFAAEAMPCNGVIQTTCHFSTSLD